MPFRFLLVSMILVGGAAAQTADHTLGYDDTPLIPGSKWRVHDRSRPRPQVVAPGADSTQAPADATVLFDGKDLSKWVTYVKGKETEPKWIVRDGYVEAVDGTGGISTREKFGAIQLHVEWAAPAKVEHSSQDRGNSGIMLMGRYEVQVLDSYENPTYADGQAASIYGQFPPPVNVSRKPGEWQTYDIVWHGLP